MSRRLLILARISSAAVGAATGAALGSRISYTGLIATGSVLVDTDLRYGGAGLGALIGWLSLPVLLFLSVNATSMLLAVFGAQLSGDNTVRFGVVVLVAGGILELYRTYTILTERDLVLGRRIFVYVLVSILFWTMAWAPRERKDLLDRLSARLSLPWLQKQLEHAISSQSLPELVSTSERLVAALEAVFGPDHPALAGPLHGLGNWYRETGNPKAASCYWRALDIAEKHFQPNDPRTAMIVSNLGGMYRKIGKSDKARECYLKAIDIDLPVYGKWHPEYATDLNNLATTYMDEGNYDEARPWLEKALEIDLLAYGPWHHVVAQDYQNWAGIFQAEGDFQEAEKFCRRALAILEIRWPRLTLRIADVLIALADIKAGVGDYAEAIQLIERVLQLDREALGQQHIEIGSDLLMLAELEAHRGNRARAIELIPDVLPFEDTLISSMMLVTTDAERLVFLARLRSTVDFVLTLASESSEIKPVAYQLVLGRKGLTSEVSSIQQEASLVDAYPQTESIFTELRKARMELAHHMFSIPSGQGGQTIEVQKLSLDKLRERCQKLERDLARHVPEVRLQQQVRVADQWTVASRLPKGSVLVDFVRVAPHRLGATRGGSRYETPRYLAFILHAGKADEVRMIDLGEAGHIDANIARFRKCVIRPSHDYFGETLEENRDHLFRLCRQLYCSVFSPIKEALKEGVSKPLFLSPDGELNLLPFEALLSEEGKFVIEEYRLNYVASGRDMLRFGQKLGEPTQALIIADPDFDLFIEGAIAQSEDRLFTLEEYLTGDEPRPSQDFHNQVVSFKRLRGAREEGEKVAELLRGENVSVRTWFDCEALEGPLRTVCAPRILHLATHGFFEEDKETKQEDVVIQRRGGGRSFLPPGIENPLLRSGLVLAGVNTFLQKRQLMPEAEDGILTALDVCGLNLYGTELVTLSACDTGVGEVHRGEGVFGLRRAFHQAGARTLVMSMWRVGDEETRILMEQFYRNLLSGLPKPDALRRAQLYIMRKMREGNLRPEYGFPHPFFWAAFICQGDPAPLRFDKTGH